MSKFKWYETIADETGKVLVGATVTFFVAGTDDLATLYADDDVTVIANPLTADAAGMVQCKLDPGSYDILAERDTYSLLIPDYVVAAQFDPSDVDITGGKINGVTIGDETPGEVNATDLSYSGELTGGGA